MAESYSEKVSVNINSATLSYIDLLVDNGYYSNRSDFINQALREGLGKYQSTLDRIIAAKQEAAKGASDHWFIGVATLEKSDLEEAKARGEKIHVTCYGVLAIDKAIDDESLFETVASIKVKGKLLCRPEIRQHYGLK